MGLFQEGPPSRAVAVLWRWKGSQLQCTSGEGLLKAKGTGRLETFAAGLALHGLAEFSVLLAVTAGAG